MSGESPKASWLGVRLCAHLVPSLLMAMRLKHYTAASSLPHHTPGRKLQEQGTKLDLCSLYQGRPQAQTDRQSERLHRRDAESV